MADQTEDNQTSAPAISSSADAFSSSAQNLGANQAQPAQKDVSTPPPPPWVQEKVSEPNQARTKVPPPPPSFGQENQPQPQVETPAAFPQAEEPVPETAVPQTQEGEGSPPPPAFSTSSVGAAGGLGGDSLIKKILPIVGVVIGVGIIIFLILKVVLPKIQGTKTGETGADSASKTKTSLTYWGLWESEGVVSQIIADYEQEHPEVTINYVQHSPKDYRERLQSALASGEGPDIFRYHNTWVPMLKTELDTAPKGTVNLEDYFPIVTQDLQVGTELVGIPLMFDGLALYYNPRLFDEAGKSVPTTWEEMRKTAKEMTVNDNKGKIQTAGVALGTTNNVDNFSDILGLMLLQNGADPAKASSSLVEETLRFYTIFTKTDRVWNETLPASTYAFAIEKVAMILAPSWRAFQIKEINPDLVFRTAPVPQLPGAGVTWASYWVEGVSKRSKNARSAWDFLKYLSSDTALTKMYTNQANSRLFGEPYPKKSLAKSLESDPIVGAFVKQGETAKSWYLASRTYDNGINDRIIKYYEDAINKLLVGKSSTEALQPVAAGVAQVLSQYGLTAR